MFMQKMEMYKRFAKIFAYFLNATLNKGLLPKPLPKEPSYQESYLHGMNMD